MPKVGRTDRMGALGVSQGKRFRERGPATRGGGPPGAARLVVAGAASVGLFTGLLANGGGFLLVPLFVVGLGLGIRSAAGTSLIVIAALAVPTLVTHWALGHIDWTAAAAFAAGAVPAALLGSRLAQRLAIRSVLGHARAGHLAAELLGDEVGAVTDAQDGAPLSYRGEVDRGGAGDVDRGQAPLRMMPAGLRASISASGMVRGTISL